jgi:Cof subfamily protein (haloacid dehalogenase superfamily)
LPFYLLPRRALNFCNRFLIDTLIPFTYYPSINDFRTESQFFSVIANDPAVAGVHGNLIRHGGSFRVYRRISSKKYRSLGVARDDASHRIASVVPLPRNDIMTQPLLRVCMATGMIITQESPSLNWSSSQVLRGLFVCDLDGTLLRSDRSFSTADLDVLKRLGALGIIRVIATGRSIYSIHTVDISELPVDFIIFSSGAGIIQHPGGRIIRKVSLESQEVNRAIKILQANHLDFMVHHPIPDNHAFSYFESTPDNEDFKRRIALYRQFAKPLEESTDGFGPATQLLAIVPPAENLPELEIIREKLPDFNVIQTTSPLDARSTWIEIFPANVSKSHAAAWLNTELGLNSNQTLSIGNDYNDLDLLEWAGTSFVVENAPQDLKKRFAVVASHNESGVSEAVECWLASPQFNHHK